MKPMMNVPMIMALCMDLESLVAHAFLGCLGKAEDAEADENPEGENHGLGNGVLWTGGRDQAGINGAQSIHALFHAATGVDHRKQHDHRGDGHDNALNGVGQDHGPKASDRSIKHHRQTKQQQADHIGITGHGLKESRSSNELGKHGRHEEDQQSQRTEHDTASLR